MKIILKQNIIYSQSTDSNKKYEHVNLTKKENNINGEYLQNKYKMNENFSRR